MILLVASAWASTTLVACDIFQPIAGTSGWENARAATRITAETYGAGGFARSRLRKNTLIAIDMHVVAGVTRVPAWCADTEGRIAEELYLQPVDVGATNLGFQLPLLAEGPLNSSFRLFYASSVTQTTTLPRVLTWTAPLFNLYPAFSAPILGKAGTYRGIDAYAVDWIGGATFRSDVISVQTGYTGSKGLYFDLTQERSALFANSVLRDLKRLGDPAYLMGGIQQFDPKGLLDEKVGLSSLFYRDLALNDDPAEERAAQEEAGRGLASLKTVHLRQEDMSEILDLRLAATVGAQTTLHEGAVAIHTKGWNREEHEDERALYARVGVVGLPDIPTMGVRGGLRPTLRVDVLTLQDGAAMQGRFSVRMNDPDVLALFPFAYNALSVNFEMSAVE